jgi:hypothetical protein
VSQYRVSVLDSNMRFSCATTAVMFVDLLFRCIQPDKTLTRQSVHLREILGAGKVRLELSRTARTAPRPTTT